MNSEAAVKFTPSPKSLASLGRDEMNLAEFPISLLTDRVPKDQNVAVYQDEIYDEKSGLTLSRKLTITAGNHGLTTATDDDVILSLIQLTREKNNFTDRRVEFSRHELVQRLGWTIGGQSYDRLLQSLTRWTSVFLQYENAWRDNRTKTWTTVGFHIIDKYEIADSRNGQLELLPSYIIWGQDIFESFQAGYLKPLDYDLCMGLRNSTAKRMYRFLDKRFFRDTDLEFELKLFAHDHIGLGHHYEGPAHLKRNLYPAIEELEKIGFLEPLEMTDRFKKIGREWKIRLIKKAGVSALSPKNQLANIGAPQISTVVAELTARGVTKGTAHELEQQHQAGAIAVKIDVFDWLMSKNDKKLAKNPAGYLVKSIIDDYAIPKGFVSRADRERQETERHAREQQQAEARRHQREQEAAEKSKDKRDAAYWASLTPDEQAELQAQADATDPDQLTLETGPLKRSLKSMGQSIRRRDYIRRLLDARENGSTKS